MLLSKKKQKNTPTSKQIAKIDIYIFFILLLNFSQRRKKINVSFTLTKQYNIYSGCKW